YVVPTGRVKVPAGRYVVPTGRVKVPAGRYVVPTGKDNVIVSAGRSKVIPAVLYNLNRLEDLSGWTLHIGPFKILERIGPVAYKLELPEKLSNIHNTFHISNLKKCLSDKSLVIPMKELRLDDKLNFVEEPVEIMDQEVKQLKQSRIPIVKARWNSKRGPKFT
ncbi:hypothetical protein Tco_1300170, partial [Tanacetum coccineum]